MILTDRKDFGAFVAPLLQQGTGAEIGTRYGMFARQIAEHWPGRIICVDLWPDQEIFEVAQEMLKGGKFHLYRGDSVALASEFQDGGLDWAYIDADHHYANVKADLAAWFPKVRPGGLVAGHDYVRYSDMGVIEAVDEFAREHGYKVSVTTDDQPWHGVLFPTWYFIK